MKRSSPAKMQQACDAFNRDIPIGTRVRVWSGAANDGPGEARDVVQPGAYVLGGHTAVVQIDGKGCIALSHVRREP